MIYADYAIYVDIAIIVVVCLGLLLIKRATSRERKTAASRHKAQEARHTEEIKELEARLAATEMSLMSAIDANLDAIKVTNERMASMGTELKEHQDTIHNIAPPIKEMRNNDSMPHSDVGELAEVEDRRGDTNEHLGQSNSKFVLVKLKQLVLDILSKGRA